MSLEASLRLNQQPSFLPEEEHLFYTANAERKTAAKVYLSSHAIENIDCVVYADYDVGDETEAEVEYGIRDGKGRKAVLHEMRSSRIKPSMATNGRPEWVVPLYAKDGPGAEEALFREEGKMRMRMLSEKHCFVVSVTVGERHQTFAFFFDYTHGKGAEA